MFDAGHLLNQLVDSGAAARADGQIDTRESQTFLNQINSLDMPVEDKAFLFEEYARPPDVHNLTADVDSQEHAAEIHAALVLMIGPPSSPEQIFLDTLVHELALDAGLVK